MTSYYYFQQTKSCLLGQKWQGKNLLQRDILVFQGPNDHQGTLGPNKTIVAIELMAHDHEGEVHVMEEEYLFGDMLGSVCLSTD